MSFQSDLIAARKARLARIASAGQSHFDRCYDDAQRHRAVVAPLPPVKPTLLPAPKTKPLVTLPNQSGQRLPLQVVTIQGIVCEKFNIPRALMIGPGRTRPIVRPRQIAMFLTREFIPAASLPAIGRKFGGRDHTTTLHGIKTIGAMLKLGRDPILADIVDELRAEIRRTVAL